MRISQQSVIGGECEGGGSASSVGRRADGSVVRIPPDSLELGGEFIAGGGRSDAVVHGLAGDGQRDAARDLTNPFQWRQQRLVGVIGSQFARAQRAAGCQHHAIGDPAGASHDRPKPYAGKDVAIVALGDVDATAAIVHRLERTAGGDQRATLCPFDEIDRAGFAERRGIG